MIKFFKEARLAWKIEAVLRRLEDRTETKRKFLIGITVILLPKRGMGT